MLRIVLKNIACAAMIAVVCLSAAIILAKHQPKRYAVFAGYNQDGTIHPYVISYLKGLNEICAGVVYIADSELRPEEEAKLKPLTIHYENKRHEEYDFGSYKRGYNWLKANGYLDNADELIFANDSTYAPMTSFKPMFKKMSQKMDIDFWGNTQNHRFNPHIQTYFIVFKKSVIQSRAFADFINKVHHQNDSSEYILNYEVKLTPHLQNLGYKWTTYIPYEDFKNKELPDNNAYPLTLLSTYHNQFLKRRTFTTNLDVREDKGLVLKYLEDNYPKKHQEIVREIFPK